MACAGFILAGAEKKLRGGRNKIRGGRLASPVFFSAPPAEFDYAPPAEFDSAPGAELTGGGAENLIIPRERGRNI